MKHGKSEQRRSIAAISNAARCFSPPGLRWFFSLIFLCGLVLALGCGSSGKDKLVPVSGKVTLSGTPLTAGQVAFHPDTAKGNTAKGVPAGAIGADGTYTLSTDGKSGAPAGWYKVTVVTNFPGVSGEPVPINAKYGNPSGSGLEREVVPSPASGAYDLQVTK